MQKSTNKSKTLRYTVMHYALMSPSSFTFPFSLCSNAQASLSSAFCRAPFSFSRSANALSRSVVFIALMAFVFIFLMSIFLAGALHCGHLLFPPLAFDHLSMQLSEKKKKKKIYIYMYRYIYMRYFLVYHE